MERANITIKELEILEAFGREFENEIMQGDWRFEQLSYQNFLIWLGKKIKCL